MSETDSMKLYPGFAWAIPEAFAAAVHACRFEQGDVLYSEASAYSGSKRAKRPARYHIQVLDPPRTTRALGSEGEGQRFFSNWESPVTFEWRDYQQGRLEERTTMQGHLFTCLWKGHVEVLQADSSAELDRPLLLRDLQSCVDPAAERVASELPSATKSKPRQLFVAGLDQSSDASRVKGQAIIAALEACFDVEIREFTPAQLQLDRAERFHPALLLLAAVVATGDTVKVEEVLREVLYAGGKNAGKDGGRFQLARHGSLREL